MRYKYNGQRCEHGYIDHGKTLCPECGGAIHSTMPVPKPGTKIHQVLLALSNLIVSSSTRSTTLRDVISATGLSSSSVEQVMKGLGAKQVVLRGQNSIRFTPEGQALVDRMGSGVLNDQAVRSG